jgi:rfaE bifunctional protein kinase chain/domain|tara:strand:+ start:1038 stop:2024 length:987 start_codon:yes stop_codon:yes gene_type:complete
MKKKEIKQLFDSFKNMTVLIVGDSMIDSYMWGKIERQSPEAPVPVVEIEKHENRLGGAANVARNIKSLGAEPILCSVIGDDYNGYELKKLLEQEKVTIDGIIHELGRKTTTKTRVISEDKHQLRIDEEQVKPINSEEKLLTIVYENMQNTDVIILQDYNKGVLTPKVIEDIIKKANKLEIPTIIDPKIKNFNSYRNCTIFKPNLKEIKIGCNINFNENDISEIKSATIDLLKKMNAEGILLTLSDKGICIQTEDRFYHTKAEEREIIDVSGAGDTVISTAALCLAAKIDNLHLSQFANLSGGLVCEKVGVVPVDKSNLYNASIAYFTK